MGYSKKAREEYNIRRQNICNMLGITKNRYNAYRRIGDALRKIYENNCNGLYETESHYELACLPYEQAAGGMARKDGLHIYYQTDPRGATIYLDKIEIPNNNYTKAYVIY